MHLEPDGKLMCVVAFVLETIFGSFEVLHKNWEDFLLSEQLCPGWWQIRLALGGYSSVKILLTLEQFYIFISADLSIEPSWRIPSTNFYPASCSWCLLCCPSLCLSWWHRWSLLSFFLCQRYHVQAAKAPVGKQSLLDVWHGAQLVTACVLRSL